MGLSSDSPSGPIDEEHVEMVCERRSKSRENMLSKVDLSFVRVDLRNDNISEMRSLRVKILPTCGPTRNPLSTNHTR